MNVYGIRFIFTPRVVDALIARAKRTPYFHLHDYMDRWWLVPYKKRGTHGGNGTGPVPFRSRPIAWVLQRLGIAIRIHRLYADDEATFHDHPWPYCTIILRGGYLEVRPIDDPRDSPARARVRADWRHPGWVGFRRASSLHYLLLSPLNDKRECWTLFITWRKREEEWGFIVDGKKVPWYEHLRGTRYEPAKVAHDDTH